MHPILFHIPLPSTLLPLFWVLLGAGGVALAIAAYQLIAKNKSAAGILAVIALVAAGAGFYLKGETWQIGPTPIYSYGVMLGLSLVVGWYLTLGLAERDGLPKETMANNYVVTALAAIVGSRVLYVLTNLHEFDTFASVFAMRRGGLVAYGGFLGGLAGSFFFLRQHKIPLLPWADVAVPSLASGLMITRIGCYLFGCDFGRPLKDSAPAFLKKLGTFPHWPDGTLEHGSGSPAWAQHVKDHLLAETADRSLPVHPTQLYESLVGLGLLGLLLVMRRRQKFRGEIFFLFAFAYGVCRFLLELLRDDKERGEIPPSLAEHILVPACLAILAVGFVIGFSKLIKNVALQRAAQVAAFVPAVALYFALKPESFGMSQTIQLSTSQFVAVTTGFAACAAFAVFYKAALAHPENAMALGLPIPVPEAPLADEDEDEDEENDDDRRPARAKVVAKPKAKPATAPANDEGDEASDGAEAPAGGEAAKADEDEDEASPKPAPVKKKSAAKAKPKAKPPAPKLDDGDDDAPPGSEE